MIIEYEGDMIGLDKAPWEDWAVILLPLAVSMLIVVWMIANRGRQSKRAIIAQRFAIGLLMSVSLFGLLLPSVERVHREYYKGKDQFQWVSRLRSEDEATRLEAISALCNILKSPDNSLSRASKSWIVDRLAAHGTEAKAALPVLKDILENEDSFLRSDIRHAIKRINSATNEEYPSD